MSRQKEIAREIASCDEIEKIAKNVAIAAIRQRKRLRLEERKLQLRIINSES